MQRFVPAMALILLLAASILGQRQPASPTETAINFYHALKDKKYVDGFRRSVYRDAVEGLTPSELEDLEPEFARTFSGIPDKITGGGEEVKGDTADVLLKFDGIEALQGVSLIRVGGEWLVGDRETLKMVRAQGHAFFFNIRISVSEGEINDLLLRLVGAEFLYAQSYQGRFGSLQELIKLGGIPKDLESGEVSGYRFSFNLSADQSSFYATATPMVYGRSGRLSFYADVKGVRAADMKGQPASASAPMYREK